MKQVTVHIATTDGPAGIQRITAEDPEVRSVVCLDGKAISLPISSDYDAFVRKPTGVIEASFGHGAFRVDVASEISGGLSWQLGVFIAHALAEAGRLVSPDDRSRLALWASGEVDRDLRVGAVQDIGLKLAQSKDLFARLRQEDIRILIAVPTANAAEAEAGVQEILGSDAKDVRIVAADSVADILSALRLPFRRRARSWAKKSVVKYSRGRARRASSLAGAAAAALAVVVLTGWNSAGEPEPRISGPALPTTVAVPVAAGIETDVTVSRAPTGSTCAEVNFGVRPPFIDKWPVSDTAALPALRTAGLCDLTYRITNSADDNRWVWVIATRDDGTGGRFRTRAFQGAKPLAARQSLDFDAMPPRRLDRPLHQEFAVLVTRPGIDPTDPKLQQAVKRVEGATARADWDQLLHRAGLAGAAVYRFRQDFRP